MTRIPQDPERKERIAMEAVVDAYDAEERAMGWYYYLDNALGHPMGSLLARCIAERAISPLQAGDEVEILGMAPENECQYEMFVMIRWGKPDEKQGLGVPLAQLQLFDGDESARQAAEDWRYWVERGYRF